MAATATAQHIPGVGTVYLAVSDQDRALAFYRDMLGFEVRTDTEFGEGFRWIEVAPAGAYTVIALVPPMRERGWQIPAYTFPKNREDLAALRVVVRQGFSHDLGDLMIADLKRQLPKLQQQAEPVHDASSAASFHH